MYLQLFFRESGCHARRDVLYSRKRKERAMAQRRRKKRKYGSPLLRGLLITLLGLTAAVLVAVLIYWRFFGVTSGSDTPQIALNTYDAEAFYEENGFLRYRAMQHMVGIDVSEHQQNVDWQAVRGSGVEFVILRVGYRGYTAGGLREDETFRDYYDGARAAGLKIGAYFFSQAMNVQQAREEATYACELLGDRTLDLPLFYDWETVSGSERIPSPDGLPLTDCAVAFCKVVRRNGYDAGVYFNQSLGYRYFDLSRLQDYTLWLAEYDTTPEFHYHFDCLQYTDSGTVNGIEGGVDLDILFLPETQAAQEPS